jgi:hypothetical protein
MKIRNIFGNEYSGAIGDKVVASRWKGIEYIRKYFIPHNPKTVFQVDQRELFDQVVVSWQPLTPEQKSFYDKMAIKMTGFNLYVKRYIAAVRGNTPPIEPPLMCEMLVTGANGVPLMNAVVEVLKGTNTVFKGLTDDTGRVKYALTAIDGPYNVLISGNGYRVTRLSGLMPDAIPTTVAIAVNQPVSNQTQPVTT